MAITDGRDLADLDVLSNRIYAEGVPHAQLALLREHRPIHFQQIPDERLLPEAWVITKYEDVLAISKDTDHFVNAHGLIAMGAERVLLVGTDTLSRITDWNDRGTAPLFADGSGAVVLESTPHGGQLLGWDFDADGTASELLWAEVGGTVNMDGKEVFRRAVRIMVDSAEKSMRHAGVTGDDITMIVPHQANIRIIQAACERLEVPLDRASVVIDRTGNTSSASIPLALAAALDDGRIDHGDLVLLVGFGGGMTAASAVLRWGGEKGAST